MNKDPRTDFELNRIIAEWMGWKLAVDPHFNGLTNAGQQHVDDSRRWKEIPSYCTDLNSVMEVVRKLGGDDQSLWYDTLATECPEDPESDIAQMRWLTQWFVTVEATPRQRAEALVYVIESKRK